MRGVFLQGEIDVEGQRGCEVYYIDSAAHEVQFSGTGHEAACDLECEPGVAGALDEEESLVRIGQRLVQRPGERASSGVEDGDVADDGHPHVGMRLQAEGQDGHADEEDRHHADYLLI